MTLQQLQYIVALAQYGQFVKAAESCFVTQPTLTMQLQKLEEEVGGLLFNRDKSPVTPTPLGEAFLERARVILKEVEGLKQLVNDEIDKVEGTYRIGVIPTIAPYLMPRLIPQVIKANSKVKIKVYELRTDEVIDGLKKGTIDLGIAATPLVEDLIKEVPVYFEPFEIYIHPDHPKAKIETWSTQDLESNEMLILDEGHCFRDQALAICARAGKKMNKGFEYQGGSLEALMGLVDRGLGYTMVPAMVQKQKQGEGQIRCFKTPRPVREVSIVVHKSFARTAFIEWLQLQIEKVVPKDYLQPKKVKRIKWK
jgi:LysR family hydrogen peroxide-inducible transcriptional activator